MVDSLIVKRWIIIAGIIAIFILTFLVIKDILVALTLGLLLAYVFSPLYKKFLGRKKKKNLIAALILLGIAIIVLIPVVYLTPIVINQTFETYVQFQNADLTEVFSRFMSEENAASFASQVDNIIGKFFSSFLNQFTEILVDFPSLMLQFAIFLFTFFFALRDSDKLKEYLTSLSPFSDRTEERLMKEFRGITNVIIFGQVLIGLIQGAALGIGLFILGVPNALVLTILAAIVSIIPVLGSWLIWLPVSVFLIISGQAFQGFFLALYGAIFVGTIDNILRPYLLSRQSNLPVSLGIIGTIGGLYFFGITGLIFGPLVFAYALIILEFYRQGKLNELFDKN